MQPGREVACGKILCAFLGGDALHRFALSEKGNGGAASLSKRGTWREVSSGVLCCLSCQEALGEVMQRLMSDARRVNNLEVAQRWQDRTMTMFIYSCDLLVLKCLKSVQSKKCSQLDCEVLKHGDRNQTNPAESLCHTSWFWLLTTYSVADSSLRPLF